MIVVFIFFSYIYGNKLHLQSQEHSGSSQIDSNKVLYIEGSFTVCSLLMAATEKLVDKYSGLQ